MNIHPSIRVRSVGATKRYGIGRGKVYIYIVHIYPLPTTSIHAPTQQHPPIPVAHINQVCNNTQMLYPLYVQPSTSNICIFIKKKLRKGEYYMYLLAQYCIVKCVSVETQSGCVQRGLILEPTLENILDSVSLSAYAIYIARYLYSTLDLLVKT